MGHDRTREARRERRPPPTPAWRHFYLMGLCLSLLVAACSTSPAPSSVTPVATEATSPTPITAYHGLTSTVFAVAWSPDGTRIVSGGNDNTIQIWNAITGKRLLTYTGHLGSIWAVVWSPDGSHVASGGNDSTVQVWDASNGHRLLTYRGQSAPVRGVTWSPDSTRIASASQDGTVQVWDATSIKRLLSYHGQTAPLRSVAWSPGGMCLASATGNTSDEHPKETVQMWNAATGQPLFSYPVLSSAGYADGTLSVAWSPDDTRLASAGADTIVHLWNAPVFCHRSH